MPAQERGDPVVDQLPHDERGCGAFDTGNGQDLTGDAVQVLGVGGDHVHEKVELAGDAVHLEDLRDGGERVGGLRQPALDDLDRDERGERVTERPG